MRTLFSRLTDIMDVAFILALVICMSQYVTIA